MSYDIHTLSSSSDEELPDLSQRAHNLLQSKRNYPVKEASTKATTINCDLDSDSSDINEIIIETIKTPAVTTIAKKNSQTIDPKLAKKQEREAKLRGKELAKLEKEKEKALKQASKPGECLKYVRVVLDKKLLENTDGSQIAGHLSNANIKYRIEDQATLNEITFERLSLQMEKEDTEPETIIVVPLMHFIALVYSEMYKKYSSGTLCKQCQKWKNRGQKLTLVVLGTGKYLKTNKTANNRQYRQKVTNDSSPPRKAKKVKELPESDAQVSKSDIENALIAAQLEEQVGCRLLEEPEKLADFVTQMAKAIAERPYKQTRGVGDFNFYAEGASTNAVKVDKNGIGLRRLWLQQLRQFNNVGVETAQAIVREYGSPRALFEAYNTCPNPNALLADIPVRRGSGPLATTRKIGPELSSKICNFFNSTNPSQILGQ